MPKYISKIKWDLIIFSDLFVSERSNRADFEKVLTKISFLKNIDAVKVLIPQDEYAFTDVLCDFINKFNINYVFSVAPESEWKKIYHTVNFNKVKFFRVLTGYLDERNIKKVNLLSKSMKERPIDIGYRSKSLPHSLGRHGLKKSEIADLFQKKAPKKGLILDISLRPEDVLLGYEWHKFLLRCKYTIGVEGGASILDRDGAIAGRTRDYRKNHPNAPFEEIEKACFPGLDGSFTLFAISPRHLEACLTKTCQILAEGSYNGILKPGKHYIELKYDFSNVDQVLDFIKQDNLRQKIVEAAYKDIVESGKYTYRVFVKFVLEQSLGNLKSHSTRPHSAYMRLTLLHSNFIEIKASIKLILSMLRRQIKYILIKNLLKRFVVAE